MALKGKASAKHYLNTKLKPIDSIPTKEKSYPVYLRIGFNKKQTDIKSRFILFGDTDFKDPLEFFDLDDECSLTKKEFENPKPWLEKAFTEESRMISEAIQFVGALGYNALEHNPAHLLSACLWTVDTVVSRHFISIIREKITKEHEALSLIVNWDVMFFDHLYRTLVEYGSSSLNKWLRQFEPLIQASDIVSSSINESLRVYEWDKTLFRNKPGMDTLSIKYVRLAIRHHYSTHFQQTHPEILKELKKII